MTKLKREQSNLLAKHFTTGDRLRVKYAFSILIQFESIQVEMAADSLNTRWRESKFSTLPLITRS